MVEDKYVGLALAVSGTVAIGSNFIITKKVRVIYLLSDDQLYPPSRRASTKQETEGTFIPKHPMTTLNSKISSGGQGWPKVSVATLHPLTSLMLCQWCWVNVRYAFSP